MTTTIDPSVKITKSFPWRGGARLWSNRYYFDNLKPADTTKWTTFCDAIVAAEKLIYSTGSSVQIVKAEGYDAGSDVSVFSKSYAQFGTTSMTGSQLTPGEVAVLVRYSTAQRTSKNHPIYLFNYYHGMMGTSAGAGDTVLAQQVTVLQTYAAAWVAGFSDGAVTHHRCGPQGHVATGYTVASTFTHRDFPRG